MTPMLIFICDVVTIEEPIAVNWGTDFKFKKNLQDL